MKDFRTMVSKEMPGKETPSKDATASEKDAAKPATPPKPAMLQKHAPLHPRELFGKGGKHPTQPPKGRSFRHQGR